MLRHLTFIFGNVKCSQCTMFKIKKHSDKCYALVTSDFNSTEGNLCSPLLFPGIDEQGLYRIVGVSSRVQKLLNLAMGKHRTCVHLVKAENIMYITYCLKMFLHQILRHVLTWSWKTQSGRLRLSRVLSSTISGLCEKAYINVCAMYSIETNESCDTAVRSSVVIIDISPLLYLHVSFST